MTKQKRDQKPAHTAIAVKKGMNRFELNVRKRCAHDYGQTIVLGVKKAFERAHAVFDRSVRRRDEVRICWTAAADPVLRTPEFARGFSAAAPAGEKNLVNLADESVRQWKAFSQSRKTMIERRSNGASSSLVR